MASDVEKARPLATGSGEGQRLKNTRGARPDRTWTSHQALGLPDLWLMIETLGALERRRRTRRSGRARSRRLDLGVWLVHARSGYAAINFSSENTVSRDSI